MRRSVEEGKGVSVSDECGDFDVFFRRWYTAVARASVLVVGDFSLGEDIAQEAFAKLWARWEAMQSADHARNFVFRSALNLARSYLRGRARLRSVEVEADPDRYPASSDEIGNAEIRLSLAEGLRGLSGRQRVCLVLVDYLGFDTRSASRMLSVRESTVRVHLARARHTLRARLAAIDDYGRERHDRRSFEDS